MHSEQMTHDQKKNLRRVVASSIIGAVIEWYDFFLYGVVAGLFFNKLYFPDFDVSALCLLLPHLRSALWRGLWAA